MLDLILGVLKTGSGTVIKLLLGIVSTKIMAVMLGPSGTGLFSLFRQTVITLSSFSAGGQTAIVQGVASKVEKWRDSYIRSTFWLFLVGAFITVGLIEIFAPQISEFVFNNNEASQVILIRWIALPVFLAFAYTYLKSVLNGYRAIGRIALIEILGPLVILMLVYPVCILVGEGYALAFVWILSASQSVMMITGLIVLCKEGWLPPQIFRKKTLINQGDFQYFFTIAGITILTGIIGTGSLLAVRSMLASWDLYQAGLFDLAWSLSGNYVMLLLGSFGTYYLPTLSQTVGKIERAALIHRVLRLSTLIMIPLIVSIIVFKPFVINIIYSGEYFPALKILRWMLIGDYLKITSWGLAIPIIANFDMKIYFWTDSFWYIGFLALSTISIKYFGELQGIGIAFILLYLILVILLLKYVQRVYELELTRDLLQPWLVGFCLVILVSIQYWNSMVVHWTSSLLWIFGSFGLVITFLKKYEIDVMLDKLRSVLRMN